MRNQIQSITIRRTLDASRFGYDTSVDISIRRGRNYRHFTTEKILPSDKVISPASVIRAKRAQVALLERFQREKEHGQQPG